MLENKNRWVTYLLCLSMGAAIAGCGSDSGTSPLGSDSIAKIPVMVAVPAGSAKIGFDNYTGLPPYPGELPPGNQYTPGPSGPVHTITLTTNFEMGKYQITNAQFCEMLNYALYKGYLAGDYVHNVSVKNREGDSQNLLMLDANYEGKPSEISFQGNRFVVTAGLENRPVVYVTWYGAAFYCNILGEWQGLTKLYNLQDWSCTFGGVKRIYGYAGYRLPTEAEWEYAARFDTNNMSALRRALSWASTYGEAITQYSADPLLRNYTNFKSGLGTRDVGSYETGKTYLGIYDMGGNASDWIQDYYSSYTYFKNYTSYDKRTNPVNDTSGVYRQRRGGSWLVYANNFPWTTYHTNTNWAYTYYCDLSFRIVKVP
jgi:formylglycine-generating enzyme required for sulfatase activity